MKIAVAGTGSAFNPLVRIASIFIKSITSAFASSKYKEECSLIKGIE